MSHLKIIPFLLICCSYLFVGAQVLPNSYNGLTNYIKSNPIDSAEVERIDAHLRQLNDAHSDSLNTVVFPALEKVYQARTVNERAFLKSVLAVSAYVLTGNVEATLRYTNEELALREGGRSSFQLLMTYSRKMFLLSDLERQGEALETSLILADQLDTNDRLVPQQKAVLYRQLCVFFNQILEIEYGETYCNKGIDFIKSHGLRAHEGALYETLALLKDAQDGVSEEEVIKIRKKAEIGAVASGDSFSLRIIYRNLAISYMELNQPDSVEKYFDLTSLFYARFPFLNGWFMDQVKYTEFLIDQGRQAEALLVLDSLESVLPRLDEDLDVLQNYYRLAAIYHASKGEVHAFQAALLNYDSIHGVKFSEEKLAIREDMLAKYDAEKKEAENQRLQDAGRIQNLIILALVLAVVSLSLGLFLYRKNRNARLAIEMEKNRYRQRELSFMEAERDKEKERNKRLQTDLEQQMQHLADQQLATNNLSQLVEELREDSPSPLVKKKTAQMKTQLRKGVDAQHYREIYEKMKVLYPELLQYLNDSLGDKEYELISTAMYFMNYETKFIASLFNKSEKAVRNMRYRVRKKLAIDEGEDFRAFLISKNNSFRN